MTVSLEEVRARYPGAETFRFADGVDREIGDYLLRLVRAGKKTGTCQAKSIYDSGEQAWPEVGRRDIALEWDGSPAVEMETLEVLIMRFDEMTEALVTPQAEFRDRADWYEQYSAYFGARGGFSPDMMIMCERFRLIHDFAKDE